MKVTEKMTGKKLLKLPPSLLSRLNGSAAVHKEDANEIIRRALTKELDLMDAQASVEETRMNKLRRLAMARGGDVDAVIDQMLRQMVEPELPLPTGTES